MKRNRKKAPRAALIATLMLAIGGFVILVMSRPESSTTSLPPASHGVTLPPGMRTVLVGATGSEVISAPGGPLRTQLAKGALPDRAMFGKVLSDEDCTPDAQGVSHCKNRVRLGNGAELTLIHPHRMADVPCLSPGEDVVVRTDDGSA